MTLRWNGQNCKLRQSYCLIICGLISLDRERTELALHQAGHSQGQNLSSPIMKFRAGDENGRLNTQHIGQASQGLFFIICGHMGHEG